MKNLSLVFFLLFLAASTSVFAQVAVDNSSGVAASGGVSTLSWSHTVGSGNNRLLVVSFSDWEPGSQVVNFVKFNGISLTHLVTKSNGSTYMQMWYLLAPPTGTYAVTVSFNRSQGVAGAVSFTGVDQTTPFGTPVTASGSGTSASVTISSAPREMVLDGIVSSNNTSHTITAGAGETEQWDQWNGQSHGAANTEPGASSVTMASSLSASTTWAMAAVSIKSACDVSGVFSYTGTPYCSNGGTAGVTFGSGGSAGAFSASPTGLSINSSTGDVNLSASTPGAYTVTNAITGTGGCIGTATSPIAISAAPSATISYGGTPYCSTGGTANVTLTGTAGGTYSSTTGLSIDPTTGAITLASSTPGTYTVTYTVAASGGCSAFSTSTNVTISTPPVISQIPSTNLIGNYKFSGNANDETGNNNGTLQNSPTAATDRFGIANSAYALNGTNQYVTTSTQYTNPTAFSISIRFKTTTTTGGYLMGFANTQTGASTIYDREVYMNNAGAIYFATFNGAIKSINSTLSYNDGSWHMVTATMSATTGMKLYVDGVQVAADATTTSSFNYSGYWRMGYGTLTAYPSVPSSFYFNGTIDDALIYSRAITATEVSTIYNSSDGAGNDGPLCGNGSLTLTATTVSGATYAWTGPNGFTSTSQNPVITNALAYAGVYSVVVTTGGCSATASTNVVATTTGFSYAAAPYCSNGTMATVTLNGAATAGAFTASPAGLSLNATTGAIDIAASTPGTYTVTNTVNGVNGCVSSSSSPITINTPGTWTGATSTSWADPSNWLCGVIPDNTTNVIIPSSLFNYPVINALTPEIKNLTLQSGASITVTNGTFKIKGAITNSGGSINATAGKIEFTGTVAQSVPAGLFSSNIVKDMLITNPAGVTLAGPVRITASLGFGNVNNSVLTTGGFLTLVSTSSNSANVLDITNGGANTGNSISGLVTVERYVQGKRAYRFLTAPVNSTSSIKANWMENTSNTSAFVNNNPVPGYGTHITGSGGSTNGFDATQTNNPSLFTFNLAGQSWTPVANTSGTFAAGNGYRIMVRGSRSVDLNNNDAASSATTLRATGTLVTGTVTMAKAGGGGTAGMPLLTSVNGAYSYVANPYASAVNWLSLDKTDLSSTIYVFDPTVSGSNGRGAYVAYNGLLNINNVINSLINNYIQSGQGFFVQTTGPNPSLTFKETYKSTAFRPVFRTAANDLAHLSVDLLLPSQVGTSGSADGTRVYFSDDFNAAIGDEDSYKFTNLDENIAVLKNGKVLSLEGRTPVYGTDTVQLKVWQLSQSSYTLKVGFESFPENVEGYLEDNFLHTSTPLNTNGQTLVPFGITSDAASSAADRFKIVFESLATLPVRLTGVKAYAKNKGVQVDWTAESESNIDLYEVERSADAQHFETIASSKANNNPAISWAYNGFDVNPNVGDNYYRIKIIDKSGDVRYSEIVKVVIAKNEPAISVFPNPVRGSNINVIFTNLAKGTYPVMMINSAGQKVYTGQINHSGGNATQTIQLKNTLPAGTYELQVTTGDTIKNIAVSVQ